VICLKVSFLAEGLLSEKRIEIDEGQTYEDLLSILDINPETVVVLKGDLPVPIDDQVDANDVKIIRIVSSG
jgi:sulfur carrier protein